MISADEEWYRTDQQVCLSPLPAGRPANPKQRTSYCFFLAVTRFHSHWIQWDPEPGFSVNIEIQILSRIQSRIFDDKNGLNFVVEKEVCLTIAIFRYHTYVRYLPFHQQVKNLLSLKTFREGNKQNNLGTKNLLFVGILKVTEEKSRIRIRNTVVQIRGSGTLVSSNLMPSWAMQN
jgi:hypothetical protein